MNISSAILTFFIICAIEICTAFVALPETTQSRTAVATMNNGQSAVSEMVHKQKDNDDSSTSQRREFIRDILLVPMVSISASGLVGNKDFVANAAMKSDQKVFEVGKELTLEEAKARFKEGQESLDYLLKNYDEICEGGGDNVRRYLGTVGTTSGLYGIAKVMKILQAEADDIVEYTEIMNEVNSALVGADGSAYMAIFTGTSTSGVPESKYYGDAKIEIKRAIASMQELARQMNIR